ncbi:glycine cleavage system protein GcvH [Dehalobacterium formicoaceticum]|uniref:Glycine cleavage system H protein n=1 Tax=Dehalobacterium formicoaceticum TaxID=51515 RepID=A0ABT1Y1J4_9FIRM|nr:glycine cleavage system protein GcvH [Dehalobacterium formicoaceticum]MCR6544731.1 glycine cleavage system protein GcvH [Dehalobacterium formicoaceticum]
MANSNEFKFTETHEWVRVEGNKAYVGITDFAQEHLGEIVFVELPQVGDELSSGGPLGVIESVKAASDVYAPVSGKVVEINEDLLYEPGKINEQASESWLVAIEFNDSSELDGLLDDAAYEKLCQEED